MARSMWYYDHDGRTGGPVSVSQLRELAANGDLAPTDRVRKEDMDRWVKARAVKGLFNIDDASLPPPVEPVETESAFDFFGVGPPLAATAPPGEFHPAFDFFAGPPPPPAAAGERPVEPPPVAKSRPPQKSKPAAVPIAKPAPPLTEDSATFQVTVPMAAPVESRDENPASYPDFHADVPMAMPASAIHSAPPPISAELTGPEVTILFDGTAQLSGGMVELSVTGGWLAARSALPDGTANEIYLRLRRLNAVSLRERSGAGFVLSFHAGPETVAVQIEGDAAPARAFLRRVLDSAE